MNRVAGDGGNDSTDAATRLLGKRFELLRGPLRRYFLRKVPDQAEADDLVQDVFLRIVKRGGAEQLERFDGYVFETAASVLKDRLRRRAARAADRHIPFEPADHAELDVSAEEGLAAREALRAATAALMELPERTRTVFILRRLEALPYGEIAARLGLSVSAVEKHMLRAARHLVARAGKVR